MVRGYIFMLMRSSPFAYRGERIIQGETDAKYRLPQVRSEFLFELLDRIGPLNRFGRLVVVGEKVTDGLLQVLGTDKVIGLQQLPLQNTKPDLQLVQPGSVRR